ncbi:MAG: hypothetical protein Q7R79_03305 [bacterium]|nr:hypothetical protein [bacterium]
MKNPQKKPPEEWKAYMCFPFWTTGHEFQSKKFQDLMSLLGAAVFVDPEGVVPQFKVIPIIYALYTTSQTPPVRVSNAHKYKIKAVIGECDVIFIIGDENFTSFMLYEMYVAKQLGIRAMRMPSHLFEDL